MVCLLDVDDVVIGWCDQSLFFVDGCDIYRPDFVAKSDGHIVVIDAVTEDTQPWIADVVHQGGHKYEVVHRRDLPAHHL